MNFNVLVLLLLAQASSSVSVAFPPHPPSHLTSIAQGATTQWKWLPLLCSQPLSHLFKCFRINFSSCIALA